VKVNQAVHCQNILGEGPIWHPEEQTLYWVDINGKLIQRFFPSTKKVETFAVPHKVSVIAPREKGGFIAGAEDGFYFWNPEDTYLEFIANPEPGKTDARFNDGKVDERGRFWAGTMTAEGATSSLYRLDKDLQLKRMIVGVTISNGIGWSPDSHLMYYVDSLQYSIFLYDFDLECGEISNRRVFFQSNPTMGVPDGLTVDSEGYIWLALYNGWKVIRINPKGKVDRELEMPVSRPSSCAFGGKNMDDLYITSISEGLDVGQREKEPLAGDLFVVRTPVCGKTQHHFAG